MTKDKVPQHVKDQRAAAAAGRTVGKRTKQLRHHRERSESYDVFRRINMHNGDKDVCWEWLGAHGTGTRGEVRPRVCIDKRHYYVYRVVYELYTGYKLQEREVVRHVCDNSWCCNPYHMLIGSQADNVDDMLQRERVGLKHYQIRRIMQALEVGCTATDVCAMMKQGYNLSLDESVVRKIRMRVIYRHIDWPWGDAYANARKRRLAELRNQRLASDPKSAIISDSQQGATTHGEEKERKDD